jgi:hypothetical protein
MAFSAFETAGLDQIVLGKQQLPSIDDRASYGDYRDMSNQAKFKLLKSIPKDLLTRYVRLKTPAEIWSKLRDEFAIPVPILYLRALEELDNLKRSEDDDDYVARFDAAITEMLRLCSIITEDEEQCVYFIRGLPTEWRKHLGYTSSRGRFYSFPTTFAELVARAREHARTVNESGQIR